MSATGEPGLADGEAGATLLEMLVVMGVLTLVSGVAFPAFRRPYQALAAQATRAAVAADLRRARARAVAQDRTVDFGVDADGGGYGWDGARTRTPTYVRLAGAPIRFDADGAASGGEGLSVRREGGAPWRLSLEPATGLAVVPHGG